MFPNGSKPLATQLAFASAFAHDASKEIKSGVPRSDLATRLVLHNRLRFEYVRQNLICGFPMTKEIGPVAKELLNIREHI
jgi:hypothetical protein